MLQNCAGASSLSTVYIKFLVIHDGSVDLVGSQSVLIYPNLRRQAECTAHNTSSRGGGRVRRLLAA